MKVDGQSFKYVNAYGIPDGQRVNYGQRSCSPRCHGDRARLPDARTLLEDRQPSAFYCLSIYAEHL